jgi:putative tryptophan/tyrosine transport system substrate-binding protein
MPIRSMRRRAFIAALGGAAAWPMAVRAQQQPAVPVIGFLSIGSPGPFAHTVAAFRRGLSEAGYVEGQNVAIEYRWVEGRNDRLPALIADLISRRVALIAVVGQIVIAATKAATTSIPIVFMTGGDPLGDGFIASYREPGANVTGATWFSIDPMEKRVGLLHELIPNAPIVGQLLDQSFPDSIARMGSVEATARALGLHLMAFHTRTAADIDKAFASLSQQGARGLVVGPGGVHFSLREQFVTSAARYAIPALYPFREFVEDGGLISYGNKLQDSYRWAGVYVGRILKGEKPAHLPVIESTTFELVINLKTAKTLGLDIPPTLLARADEVIE